MRRKKYLAAAALMAAVTVTGMAAQAAAPNSGNWFTYTKGVDGEGGDNLFDHDASTKYCITGFGGARVVWNYDYAVSPVGYTMVTGSDNSLYPGRNPASWTLYGCNSEEHHESDSKEWNVITYVEDDQILEDKDYSGYYYSLPKNLPEYKYYMLEITETRGASTMQLAEFSLFFAG